MRNKEKGRILCQSCWIWATKRWPYEFKDYMDKRIERFEPIDNGFFNVIYAEYLRQQIAKSSSEK